MATNDPVTVPVGDFYLKESLTPTTFSYADRLSKEELIRVEAIHAAAIAKSASRLYADTLIEYARKIEDYILNG